MQRLKIIPLEKEYKVISLRTTDLESHVQCPFNYRHKEFGMDENLQEIFYQGDKIHAYLQTLLTTSNPNGLDLLRKSIGDVKLLGWFNDIDAMMNAGEFEPLDITEVNERILIEMGKYLVIFSGTIDGYTKFEDGTTKQIDIKSSKSLWKEEDVETKLQKDIYPTIFSIAQGIRSGKANFEYRILVKNAKMKLQKIPVVIDIEESIVKLGERLSSYIEHLDTDSFPIRRGKHCFRCGVKKRGLCPHYNVTSF